MNRIACVNISNGQLCIYKIDTIFICSNTHKSITESNEVDYFAEGRDPVRIQYESLPYPPIKKDELENEEQFYKTNSHFKSFLRSNALETINHYLHRGKESFR